MRDINTCRSNQHVRANLLITLVFCHADASAPADVMGDQQADPSGIATQVITEPKDPLHEAFESQQEAVTADPGDFDKWVKLIGAAEKLVCVSSDHTSALLSSGEILSTRKTDLLPCTPDAGLVLYC